MATITVATGTWNDFSKSGWFTASLTLDVRSAAVLIAATATFVTIVGTRLWSILSFAIFHLRASRFTRDGVHHQQQAIYRNTSQLGTLWMLLQIAWAWESIASRNLLRFALFSLPPLICFVGVTAASILSSRIAAPSYTASNVRVAPKDCGFVRFYSPSDPGYDTQFGTALFSKWSTGKNKQATNYASNCYSKSVSTATACSIYPVQALHYSVEYTAACPFSGSRCFLGPSSAMKMKTKWMDSHTHLGINAKSKDRIRFQRVTSCSVLNVNDRYSVSNVGGSDEYTYFLGSRGQGPESIGATNFTYSWKESSRFERIGYTIAADKAMINDPYRSLGWEPMADLNRTDADVSIFFLNSNGLRYSNPVNDPFFFADREFTAFTNRGSFTLYGATNLTRFLACTDQYQIQNPNNNIATELTSASLAQDQALQIELNYVQAATLLRLGLTSYDSLIFSAVDGMSSAALRATDTTSENLSPGLPDNQWQIEVSGWFNASLARLQQNVLDFASKDITELQGFATLQSSKSFPELARMCQDQVVRNVGQYQTFSLLAIMIIFCVGILIIVVSWILEPFVGWVEKRLGRQSPGRSQWLLTSPLQLQRLALLGEESIIWRKFEREVPVTDGDTKWTSHDGTTLGNLQEQYNRMSQKA